MSQPKSNEEQINYVRNYILERWSGWIKCTPREVEELNELVAVLLAQKDAEVAEMITEVRKMLAFEGVLSMSVEKGFQEIIDRHTPTKQTED